MVKHILKTGKPCQDISKHVVKGETAQKVHELIRKLNKEGHR